ncbi:MAG: methyl-accepting chemotaxis protein [Gammaproteobacteria bacterium]|nr:methyl-accepting chemotaxis protein [Gammaproteobacteria bacterium]
MKSLFHRLKYMGIKQKMFFAFGAMVLVIAIIGFQTMYSLLGIKASIQSVVEEHQESAITAMELSKTIESMLSGLSLYLLSNEKIFKDNFTSNLKQVENLLKGLKAQTTIVNSAANIELVKKIETDFNHLKSYQEQLLELPTNNEKNYPGLSYSNQFVNPIIQEILQNLQQMIASEQEKFTEQQINDVKLFNEIQELRFYWVRLMSGIRAYLAFHNPIALNDITNYKEIFVTKLSTLEQKSEQFSFTQEESYANIKHKLPTFTEELNKVLIIQDGGEWRTDVFIIRSKLMPILKSLLSNLDNLSDTQVKDIKSISVNLMTNANNTIASIIFYALLAMGCIVLLAYLLLTGIINPMNQAVEKGIISIKKVMENFSSDDIENLQNNIDEDKDPISSIELTLNIMGRALENTIIREQEINEELKSRITVIHDVVKRSAQGDLSGQMTTFTGTEPIDYLANDTQMMVTNLSELVSKVQHSGIQVNSSATEIAATSKQQEATVSEQAASTNEIMATVTEISATSRELLHTMEEISHVAENTAHSGEKGQLAIVQMEKTMQNMSKSTETIASKLAVLNEKASNINTVVTTINKVADQTNLLSLNAAIEAEKAGEYGKGFAVVATEIRRLADQTAVATWDIEQMIKEMQRAVSAGVMGMDKFTEDVNRGVEEIGGIGEQLGHIIHEVQALTPQIELVTEGMQSQSLGSEQIRDSMTHLNDTAHQTAESLKQSNQSIQLLKGAANGLQTAVSIFKVRKNG